MGSRGVAWAATVLVGGAVWVVCGWLLYRTSVPSLQLSGLDPHRFFTPHELSRAARFTRGADLIWLGGVLAELAALVVLVRVLPRRAATIGLGRIGTAGIVGLVLLTVVWGVSLPFGILGLWWDHHWGLGPFDVASWLVEQRATLGAEAVYALATIVLVVGLAGRFGRRWILLAWPVFVAVTALFAFASGYLGAAGTTPVRQPWLRAEIARLEQVEHVQGTPVRIDDVRSVTNQANAFTVGIGPSTHVVLWNTFLDPRYSHREVAVVIAHELGHARSRHILKAVGWTALLTLPALWLLERATRRRGGLADPASVPLAALVLVVAALLLAPFENAVSRRYEAEADWRALNATRDPVAARQVFRSFGRVSLEQPDPPLWDYLWLENHPTPMQRIAMAEAWASRR
jgi:Zn-dependent protease with chaperone function